MVNAPTVISTFSGCGGSSLGYKWAGFKELLAIDFDQNSVNTFRINFPDVLCWQSDIREVSGAEILRACNLYPGELDILDGSPPCQGFSTLGKRKVLDPRNDLFQEYIRLIKDIQPRAFVMENVSGMVRGKMKGRFLEVMAALKTTNYKFKCKLMNSANYDVPQSRPRLVWIGIRPDLNVEPSFPPHSLKPLISVAEAIKTLPKDKITAKWLKPEWKSYAQWAQIKVGKTYKESTGSKNGYSFFKVNPHRPANTIVKTCIIGNTAFSAHVHWAERRTLSIEEIKRLSSYPDDFIFIGKFEEQWARIGNSVMPRFMCHIAKHIRDTILL